MRSRPPASSPTAPRSAPLPASSARSSCSASPTPPWGTASCASWKCRAAAMRPWSAHEDDPDPYGRLAVPRQAAQPLLVRLLPRDLLADLLRDGRVLHVPRGRGSGGARVRVARGGSDGD